MIISTKHVACMGEMSIAYKICMKLHWINNIWDGAKKNARELIANRKSFSLSVWSSPSANEKCKVAVEWWPSEFFLLAVRYVLSISVPADASAVNALWFIITNCRRSYVNHTQEAETPHPHWCPITYHRNSAHATLSSCLEHENVRKYTQVKKVQRATPFQGRQLNSC